LKQKKASSIFSAIGLRYLRLTPSLAVVLLVYYKIIPQFGYGPFSPMAQDIVTGYCDETWWAEVTYTMTIVSGVFKKRMCMGWTWYLGDDMIFFVVGLCIHAPRRCYLIVVQVPWQQPTSCDWHVELRKLFR